MKNIDSSSSDLEGGPHGPDPMTALARYIHEIGQLKNAARTGWWLAGIRDPETVAEHIFRTAIIGYVLASLEGADPDRTALLCLFHDSVETRLGDIPSVGKKYVKSADELTVAEDQVAGVPDPVARGVTGAVEEYEEQVSLEAKLAKDADRIECLAQALEYKATGYSEAEAWIEGNYAMLVSDSARQLGSAMRRSSPDTWWRDFVENYRGKSGRRDTNNP
jgi:putative hydrolase of HD superfamily